MSAANSATRRRCGVAFVVWACVWNAATHGAADPPRVTNGAPPVASPPPLTFRRVHVPEEQLPELARGYLPIKRDEFQRLLDEIGRAHV